MALLSHLRYAAHYLFYDIYIYSTDKYLILLYTYHVSFTFKFRRIAATHRPAAMCHVWTAPSWQGKTSRRSLGRYSHVFGLLARFT